MKEKMQRVMSAENKNKIRHFTDLVAWKEAHELTLMVYKATGSFPKEEKYGLISQVRRAVVSVESNIAEGFNRYHFGERINFYYDARGSLGEVQSQLITAKDLEFLSEEKFSKLWEQTTRVDIILNGLVARTRSFKEK